MDDLVEVTYVGDEVQAEMIIALLKEHEIPSLRQQVSPSGPQLGYGLMGLGGGSQRVMVHAHRVEEARAVLAETMVEGEREAPEPLNARYLEEGQGGRGPRNYGLVGAFVRMFAVGFGVMGLVSVIWLLFRVF